MLAEILTAAASWLNDRSLLTYLVPPELQPLLCEGQLVAIPYGERLVEGIVWQVLTDAEEEHAREVLDEDVALRPLRAILDPEPALLAHQRALAEWMAAYYVTPLAQVAQMMLTRGLMQRSQFVLRLAQPDASEQPLSNADDDQQVPSPRLHALIGLLLAEGELDVEELKKMLGPSRSKEFMKEALASGIVERSSQLKPALAKARRKRVVHLIAPDADLEAWRQRTEIAARGTLTAPDAYSMSPDHVRKRPMSSISGKKGRKDMAFNPWALPEASAALTLNTQDEAALLAQRKLAAIDLLLHSRHEDGRVNTDWTPAKLCEASRLTASQLQHLVHEQLIAIEEMEVRRDPLQGRSIPASQPLALTDAQQRALEQILRASAVKEGEAIAPILLHGVTGSGKTEVYLQALAALIEQGKRGIMLVPEIALTTQAVQRVAGRFPERVAIIHGSLGTGERYDEWRRIRAGQVDVVIGARSALFAPIPDLGIVIVDEEHEPAYKQSGELRPSYHAREAAIQLGRILHIPVVLGSATPAVESFYRAGQGQYQLVELPGRIGSALPPVEVIDLRNELHAGNTSIISRRLQQELELVLSRGQQAILFLNRRGAASCVLCRDCGYVAICDRCDVPLTYHSTERILLCHYCGRQSKVLHFCPTCHSSGIRYFGLGTEKVESTIQQSFPAARLLRWDRDTARNRHAHAQLLDRFANREADIMIGTQMIAKGLDLPGVTLVGVISADIALNLPDFASTERAFTILTQVAGRAGRGEEPGRVIVQTFNPQHFCIDAASRHDYHEFYHTEIEARQRYGYPPFRQFVKFTYSHENRHRARNEALLLCERISSWIDRLALEATDLVGPAPAVMERIMSKYRWQIIVRGPNLHPLLRVIDAPGWEIDIDPVSTL